MGLETPSQAIGPINPGTLIGKAEPVVEPRATQALVDAFHQGVITADDIVQRVGEVGKLKQKAEVMGLQEATSPESQAARAAALQASTATNQLAGAKAGAALPGVPAAAQAAEEDVDFHRAVTAFGPDAIQSYFKYAPLVPGYTGTPTSENGKPDWITVAREGANLDQQVQQKAQAALRAVVHGVPQVRKEGNTSYSVEMNSLGEDITSPEKKAALNAAATTPLSFKFLKPGATSAPAVVPAPAPVAAPSVSAEPVVSPALNPIRDQLAAKFGPDMKTMPDQDVQRLATSEGIEVTPKTPAIPARPEVNQYVPGKGIVSSVDDKDLLTEASGITDQLRKQGAYTVWNKSVPAYNAMQNVLAEINKVPIEQQRSGAVNMNVKDLDLISNFIKLYDPEAVIREFKFDKLVSGQPLPDRLKNWKATVLRAGHLTPETRQELVSVAEDMYRAKEQAIVPDLQMAAKRAQGLGIPIDSVLNPKEQQLLGGKPAAAAPSASAAPTPASPVLKLSTGRNVFRDANGNYHLAQ